MCRCDRYGSAVANVTGELLLEVDIDGRRVAVESRFYWSAGGTVLTIATVIDDPREAAELVSTFVGCRETDTVVTHLIFGAVLSADIVAERHPYRQINNAGLARQCAYAHCTHLMDALARTGHTACFHLAESTFGQLERVS
jgi:hypothetical protein